MSFCEFEKLALLCILFSCFLKVDGKCFCKPCGPIKDKKGFQFVGYATNQDPSHYKRFDFNKLTTLVILRIKEETKNLVCYAHARGVRIVFMVVPPTNILGSWSARNQFISKYVNVVIENDLDGINIDYEGTIWKTSDPASYNGLTSLMIELRSRLRGLNELYELSMCWIFCLSCDGGRTYNYNVIKHHVDYFVIMTYDYQWGKKKYGLCKAESQNRFYEIKNWVNQWMSSGIPKEKLLFAFPWYGHRHKCYIFESKTAACYTKCQNINSGAYQRCYLSAAEILNRGLALGGTKHDFSTRSAKVIWWSDGDKSLYQMNYDDPQTLKLRYDLILAKGMRGAGSWHITCLDNGPGRKETEQRAAMWSVIPTGK